MLQQGLDSEQADYDGRTALMLATAKGHTNIALLLAAHSDASAVDLSGKTALRPVRTATSRSSSCSPARAPSE